MLNKDLSALLIKWKIEWISDPIKKQEIFLCAKEPTKQQKKIIQSYMGGIFECVFEKSPKISTTNSYMICLLQKGLMPYKIHIEPSRLILQIYCTNEIENIEELCSRVSSILEADGFFKGWELTINDKVRSFNFDIMKEVKSNLKRDVPITKDDLTNLHILLNTNLTWEDMLKQL